MVCEPLLGFKSIFEVFSICCLYSQTASWFHVGAWDVLDFWGWVIKAFFFEFRIDFQDVFLFEFIFKVFNSLGAALRTFLENSPRIVSGSLQQTWFCMASFVCDLMLTKCCC